MKPQCQLCLGDFTSLLSQPSSPVVPRCGTPLDLPSAISGLIFFPLHLRACNMFGLPQYQNEGKTVLSEVRSCESEGGTSRSIEVYGHRASELVRYRWFPIDSLSYSHYSSGRKEILDSKSYKRLQELNLILDERAAALDEERDILAKALRDYSAGMILEQALRELGAELTALDVQNGALHQQIIQETQRLSELEQKVG